MLKFAKYEWLRRWKYFLAALLILVGANVDILWRIFERKSPNYISVIFLLVLFVLGIILILDHIGRMSRCLFTDEGYWELALPMSGYKFLAAKLLTVFLECVGVVLIMLMMGYMNIVYLKTKEPQWFLAPISSGDMGEILLMAALSVGGYLIFILMIYLSLTLAKSVFASFKYSKLISFLCFLLVGKGVEILSDLFQVQPKYNIQGTQLTANLNDGVVILLVIFVLFTATAYLLERRVNL